jgi:hypothetical protein
MTGMALFPNLLQQLKGKTVNSMTIAFTVQSTNASVLPVWFLLAGPGVSELPPTFGSDTDITNFTGGIQPPGQLLMIPVPAGPAGRRVSFDMTASNLAGFLVAGSTTALVFGGFQGDPTYDIGDGAYNDPDAFAWQTVLTGSGADDSTTDMTITFEYYLATASNKVGGDGAPGGLFLSFIDPRYWPITAIEPAPTTDPNGHTFATGITTDSVVAFDPTIVTPPRIPETWHSLGALAAGSGVTVTTSRYRYSPEDGGTVVIQVNLYIANGASIVSGEYNFANRLFGATSSLIPTVSATSAQDEMAFVGANIRTSAVAITNDFYGMLVYGRNSSIPGKVSLVVDSTFTASGNSWVTAMARIPLT